MRGIDFSKVKTMDTKPPKAKFIERMRQLKKPDNPDAYSATVPVEKPKSMKEILSSRYEWLSETQVNARNMREEYKSKIATRAENARTNQSEIPGA